MCVFGQMRQGWCVWGGCQLQPEHKDFRIYLHNGDVYNPTCNAPTSPFPSLLSSPVHTHASCPSQPRNRGKGCESGEYAVTTYRLATWLNIAKPLCLWLNYACRALSFPRVWSQGLVEGGRGIPLTAMWGRCGATPAAGVRPSCSFCSALEVKIKH